MSEMTRAKAVKIFKDLSLDPDDKEMVAMAIKDFVTARASFTEEEYSDEEHGERLDAAYVLLKQPADPIRKAVKVLSVLIDGVYEGHYNVFSVSCPLGRGKAVKQALEEGVRALLFRKGREANDSQVQAETLHNANEMLEHLYESGGDRLDRGTVIDGLPVYSYNLHWQGFGVSFRDAIERDMNDYKERDE